MDCIRYKSDYLKVSEWNFLLAGLGVTDWYGLDGGQSVPESDPAAVHRMLAGLYRKEIVDWDGGQVFVKPPFDIIFASLLICRKCITIRAEKRETPVRCCYIGTEDVVLTEKSRREADALCVFSLPKEAFLAFALEQADMPEGIFEGDETDTGDGKEILAFTLKNCRNGQTEDELAVEEAGLQTYLIKGVKKPERMVYRRQTLGQYLREWIYEEESK